GTSPARSSWIAVTRARLRLSGIAGLPGDLAPGQRHINHRLEIRDCDALVRRVDVGHPVREVHTLQAALVEDVRVRAAAGEDVARRPPRALERARGDPDGQVVSPEAIPARRAFDLRLDL